MTVKQTDMPVENCSSDRHAVVYVEFGKCTDVRGGGIDKQFNLQVENSQAGRREAGRRTG